MQINLQNKCRMVLFLPILWNSKKMSKTDLLYLITVRQANTFIFDLKRKWNFVP